MKQSPDLAFQVLSFWGRSIFAAEKRQEQFGEIDQKTTKRKAKTLMKTLTKTILTVLGTGLISCALFSQQAQADPITGTITFGGSVNMNGTAATATMVT